MTFNIRTQGFTLTDALREITEAEMRLALGRNQNRVQRVDISLSDINGANKGGLDKRCLITLRLPGSKAIVIQEKGRDMYETIHLCVSRIRRTLDRHINRKRKFKRQSIRQVFVPLEAA